MANQFNIQAYVRPGRIDAPENSYPSNPIKYVSKQMIANRPKGAARWIEEETYSAALTQQQAQEIQKDTPWIQHQAMFFSLSLEYSFGAQKASLTTEQFSPYFLQNVNDEYYGSS